MSKSFLHNLCGTRYAAGKVAYLSAGTSLYDWFAAAPRNARDGSAGYQP
ncbi:hypothetical protein KCP78_14625 [Salmonella enterica subsp. enterica]|nr:hypothetical protein KCP78_14625 [Salmonella enterica subsp. enterica]